MPITKEPLNQTLRPFAGTDKTKMVLLKGEPAFIGQGETAGEHFYLCSGCGRTLFRKFTPDGPALATAFQCRCGQTNIFEQYAGQ